MYWARLPGFMPYNQSVDNKDKPLSSHPSFTFLDFVDYRCDSTFISICNNRHASVVKAYHSDDNPEIARNSPEPLVSALEHVQDDQRKGCQIQ